MGLLAFILILIFCGTFRKGQGEQASLGLTESRMTATDTFFICGVTVIGRQILLTD